jgi:alpha-D-ribose 1-methylphosphonate 5-triphosphate diphosphatase
MTSTRSKTVIGNARIVLADRVIERGWIAFADGRVAGYGEGNAPAGSADAAGDLIMPGLIELHTDHLEAHYVPRPKVFWDPIAAVVSYDGQLATSGITTVLDSLRVWREDGAEEVDGRAGVLAEAIAAARDANLLRSDHFLHLRCEIPMLSVVGGQGADWAAGCTFDIAVDRPRRNSGSFRRSQAAGLLSGRGPGMTDANDILFERRFA